jgi:putative glutamine amidotransferase
MKIGLTYTGSPEKHQYYERWLRGDEPIEIIKLSAGDWNVEDLKTCDALVLAGGRDLHPKFYKNKDTDYPNTPGDFDEKRDEFEITAFKQAQERGIPVLGICRGMQLVNCILDGTLKQDMGEALNKIHRVEATDDKTHVVNIESNTMISEIAGAKQLVVNSAHHQAVEKLGEGLKVNCRADDGTIEGFEWADRSGKPFLLCVQWHPERMFKFQLMDSPLSKNIRNKLIEEIRTKKQINENH